MPSKSDRPFDVYLPAQPVEWLDSMEGVPEFAPPPVSPESFLHFDWQKYLHRWLERFGTIAPGLVLAIALALAGGAVAKWTGTTLLGFDRSPVSPILATVLLGLGMRNVAGLPTAFESGLLFCVKQILRLGVALLGLRLSLIAAGEIGLLALPVVIGCITAALLTVTWLSRAMGLSPRLGSLIAVGTGICGVSAIVATAPAIDADDDEVSYSVATITLFGTIALFAYPFLSHWIFDGDALLAGMFLGTAIHDTSQVAGAGLMYASQYDSPQALEVAATTKLVRNLSMGLVIPLIAVLYHRRAQKNSSAKAAGTAINPWLKAKQWIPGFVIGFVALAALRTAGDLGQSAFGFLDRSLWESLIEVAKSVSVFCLATAMAAVGLGTSFARLRSLGWKPLFIGFVAAALVGAVSVALIFAVHGLL